MRRKNKPYMLFLILLVILVLAWWISGQVYDPQPDPTPTYTSEWIPPTWTAVPTYTPVQTEPVLPTATNTLQPTHTQLPQPTETPVPSTEIPVITETATPAPVYIYPVVSYPCEFILGNNHRQLLILWCKLFKPAHVTYTPAPVHSVTMPVEYP